MMTLAVLPEHKVHAIAVIVFPALSAPEIMPAWHCVAVHFRSGECMNGARAVRWRSAGRRDM